jgi:hypothetical protein
MRVGVSSNFRRQIATIQDEMLPHQKADSQFEKIHIFFDCAFSCHAMEAKQRRDTW